MGWEPLPGDRSTIRPVGSSLNRLRRTMGLARSDTLELIESNWSQIIGARLAPLCALHSLRDGVLVISVSDPAVAENLKWSATDLVGAINAVCGGAEVNSVEVRTVVRRGE